MSNSLQTQAGDTGNRSSSSVSVRGWTMTGKQGDVFSGVDLDVAPGSVAVIRGSGGSGKTSLLLSLAGRMKVSAGEGQVDDLDIRTQSATVRSRVSVGHVAGLTDLEKDFTVGQHIAERLIMLQPWYRPWVSKASLREVITTIRETIVAATEVVDRLPAGTFSVDDIGDADFLIDPDGETFVSELSELQKFLLEFSLASLAQAPVMVIDNIDVLRQRGDRARAWAGLLIYQELRRRRDPDTPLTVIVSCEDSAEVDLVTEALGSEISPSAVVEFLLD